MFLDLILEEVIKISIIRKEKSDTAIALNLLSEDINQVSQRINQFYKDYNNNWNPIKFEYTNASARYIDLRSLAKKSNIEEIDLSGNKVVSIDLQPLSNLHKLRVLNLSSNKLKEINLSPLSKLDLICQIDLSKNNLQKIYLEFKDDFDRLSACIKTDMDSKIIVGETLFHDILLKGSSLQYLQEYPISIQDYLNYFYSDSLNLNELLIPILKRGTIYNNPIISEINEIVKSYVLLLDYHPLLFDQDLSKLPIRNKIELLSNHFLQEEGNEKVIADQLNKLELNIILNDVFNDISSIGIDKVNYRPLHDKYMYARIINEYSFVNESNEISIPKVNSILNNSDLVDLEVIYHLLENYIDRKNYLLDYNTIHIDKLNSIYKALNKILQSKTKVALTQISDIEEDLLKHFQGTIILIREKELEEDIHEYLNSRLRSVFENSNITEEDIWEFSSYVSERLVSVTDLDHLYSSSFDKHAVVNYFSRLKEELGANLKRLLKRKARELAIVSLNINPDIVARDLLLIITKNILYKLERNQQNLPEQEDALN